MFVDRRGVRAERVEILRIALVESCWPGEAKLGDVKRLLGDHYAVPVGGLEDVPGWVTANLRREGRPPDEATLDLDALDLHRAAARFAQS